MNIFLLNWSGIAADWWNICSCLWLIALFRKSVFSCDTAWLRNHKPWRCWSLPAGSWPRERTVICLAKVEPVPSFSSAASSSPVEQPCCIQISSSLHELQRLSFFIIIPSNLSPELHVFLFCEGTISCTLAWPKSRTSAAVPVWGLLHQHILTWYCHHIAVQTVITINTIIWRIMANQRVLYALQTYQEVAGWSSEEKGISISRLAR